MAITLDALLGTGKGHNVAGTLSTTNPVAAGAQLIVVVGRFDSAGGTMSLAGGGLTWATDHNLSSGSLRDYVFRAPVPAGLAASTVLTLTSSAPATTDMLFGALSLLGIDSANPVSGFNGAAAATAAWSSGSITANNGDAIVGGAFEDGSATDTSTPTSPGVEAWDFNDATQTEAETGVYKLSVAGTDSVDGTWATAVSHLAIGVAYKAAAAGAAVSFFIPRRMPLGV